MILVYPAYRRGFFIQKDLNSPWPGKFDWKVDCDNPRYCVGWFGSLESAYKWVYKEENGLFKKLTFYEWMNREYGDNWPTDDKDLANWNRYLEYVGEYN